MAQSLEKHKLNEINSVEVLERLWCIAGGVNIMTFTNFYNELILSSLEQGWLKRS